MKHRRMRHHISGLKEVARIFGDEADKAARQHIIISDIKEEGSTETDPFPKDERHYVEMCLF